MFVAVIDEAERFHHAHELQSYLRLVPTEKRSGTTGRRLGSITKKGNAYLRSLLVLTSTRQQAAVRRNTPSDRANSHSPVSRFGPARSTRRPRR